MRLLHRLLFIILGILCAHLGGALGCRSNAKRSTRSGTTASKQEGRQNATKTVKPVRKPAQTFQDGHLYPPDYEIQRGRVTRPDRIEIPRVSQNTLKSKSSRSRSNT